MNMNIELTLAQLREAGAEAEAEIGQVYHEVVDWIEKKFRDHSGDAVLPNPADDTVGGADSGDSASPSLTGLTTTGLTAVDSASPAVVDTPASTPAPTPAPQGDAPASA